MKQLPKEIAQRVVFETRDQIVSVKSIKPLEDCECGAELAETRVVKIALTEFPFPHIREYCSICRRHRHAGGEWHSAVSDLNQTMRGKNYPKKPRL